MRLHLNGDRYACDVIRNPKLVLRARRLSHKTNANLKDVPVKVLNHNRVIYSDYCEYTHTHPSQNKYIHF